MKLVDAARGTHSGREFTGSQRISQVGNLETGQVMAQLELRVAVIANHSNVLKAVSEIIIVCRLMVISLLRRIATQVQCKLKPAS